MRARGSRLRWWIAPVTFAFGSLVLDASIVATDYVVKGRIASAAPRPPVTLREGKSLDAICEQIKDPARNGGMDLGKLHEHVTHDTLVGWAWNPGKDREPAPGTRLGELSQVWIDTGAVCPSP
jgi:hypothetical protein